MHANHSDFPDHPNDCAGGDDRAPDARPNHDTSPPKPEANQIPAPQHQTSPAASAAPASDAVGQAARARAASNALAQASSSTDEAVDRLTPTRPVKRSFTISGHRTSISLENAFWEILRDIAARENRSLASLVGEIDKRRGSVGLSGAVRIWVLDYLRRLANF